MSIRERSTDASRASVRLPQPSHVFSPNRRNEENFDVAFRTLVGLACVAPRSLNPLECDPRIRDLTCTERRLAGPAFQGVVDWVPPAGEQAVLETGSCTPSSLQQESDVTWGPPWIGRDTPLKP